MFAYLTTILAASAALVSATPVRRSASASMTPHDKYSSSIGVLGCKIDINRVAYWPGSIGCDDICVKVTHQGRSVHLLKVDQSGGAHDMSYDAWNYLGFGKGAKESPQQGGGIAMEYETVHPSNCADLLDDGKLPLAAANSMNFVASCLSQPNSWVAKNHKLYNINDPVCKWGADEECHLDLAVSNQPSCPSQLGVVKESGLKCMNIEYATGNEVQA